MCSLLPEDLDTPDDRLLVLPLSGQRHALDGTARRAAPQADVVHSTRHNQVISRVPTQAQDTTCLKTCTLHALIIKE